MIHVFHGFLGSPEDFSFLKNDNVLIHDLYSMETFPKVGPDDVLIGYSMGGRIALEIAESVDYNIKKLVLISANPGLSSEEEKTHRAEWERTVIQDLETLSMSDFLAQWNDLPVFFHDAPLKDLTPERYKKSAALFEKYLLSKQRDHLPLMIEHKEKVLYVVGLFDEKYMDFASEVFIPYGITVRGIPGGHRLFQLHTELKKVLTAEGIL